MTEQQIAEMVKRIFAARGKEISPYVIEVWTRGIMDYCTEKNVTHEAIITGCREYFRGQQQFPTLGELLDKINPSAASKADTELRMIDDVAAGRRQYTELPGEVRRAIDTCDGMHDYRHGTDHQRRTWAERYTKTRIQDERGYQEPVQALPAPSVSDMMQPQHKPEIAEKIAAFRSGLQKYSRGLEDIAEAGQRLSTEPRQNWKQK
jgi:hypothetical protein